MAARPVVEAETRRWHAVSTEHIEALRRVRAVIARDWTGSPGDEDSTATLRRLRDDRDAHLSAEA